MPKEHFDNLDDVQIAPQSWLDARATIARDLHASGEITIAECDRVVEDAINGQYTGPLKYADGRVGADNQFLFGVGVC